MKLRLLAVRGEGWEQMEQYLDEAFPPDEFKGRKIGVESSNLERMLGWCDFVVLANVATEETVPLVRTILTTSDHPVIVITKEPSAFVPKMLAETGKHPYVVNRDQPGLAIKIRAVFDHLPKLPLPLAVVTPNEAPQYPTSANVTPAVIGWLQISNRTGRRFAWRGKIFVVHNDITVNHKGDAVRVLSCYGFCRAVTSSNVIKPVDD